jgi:hypothetical protein
MSILDNLTKKDMLKDHYIDTSIKYDRYYYIDFMMEPFDRRLVGKMVRNICRQLNLLHSVNFIGIDMNAYHSFEINKETSIFEEDKEQILNSLISGIDNVVDACQFLYIRIYKSDSYENVHDLDVVFSNIATTGVRINEQKLMDVIEDMFSQNTVSIGIKVL